jgi:hypothetical protein
LSQCGIKNYYRFRGSCTSGALPPGGATFKLSEYRGISARFTIPKNNGGGNWTFTYEDATGKGDIGKLNGQPFPKYPNPCGVSNCPGTAFIYVAVNVAGSGQLKPKGNNVFSFVNTQGYPGASCQEAILYKAGWTPIGTD